ncbi:DDT domain-containing protein DDR4 [Magnolia sinica]|uniref:DDT domain-containing protein DDR4 n=1 Tax=Magnolia sinica TaxID=86752 RepID=UPI0026594433|nr:DDT domain-containing protein DDR4 [Magnolia sinica]
MSGEQRRERGRGSTTVSNTGAEEGSSAVDPVSGDLATVSIPPTSEDQLARHRLRERWELASVLHFLHVFQPIIWIDSEISAEEIETALITPNNTLAELHIALLKGIPPVSKNLIGSDAWVTVVCKKIATWWRWVAEGEVPLTVARGEEISRYKELDPTIRLLILKALCEIRAEQYDLLRYIDDALKCGTQLSTFRKDRIGGDGNGTAYWYDGDSVIGHRLYREIKNVEFKQRLKGRGSLVQPTTSFQWETLATNLEEFREISDELSSSKVKFESAVGEVIKNDIMPTIEKFQKKKERALKRQQRQAMQLDDFLYPHGLGNKRTCRDRRPVSYTFDEFDRSIEEAIQMNNKSMTGEQTDEEEEGEDAADGKDIASNGSLLEIDNNIKYRDGDDGDDDDDDDDDDDYDDKSDAEEEDDNDVEDDSSSGSSEKENNDHDQRNAQKQKDLQPKTVVMLRHSLRTSARTRNQINVSGADGRIQADTKKRLRQRPNHNTNYDNPLVVPDSDDSSGSSEEADGDHPSNNLKKKVSDTDSSDADDDHK